MLIALAEGMSPNTVEVAAWAGVVVVGTVRRVVAVKRTMVQAQCLRLLLDIGMLRRRNPTVLTKTERALASSLTPDAEAAAIISELRVSPERLASMVVRILHSERVATQPANRCASGKSRRA